MALPASVAAGGAAEWGAADHHGRPDPERPGQRPAPCVWALVSPADLGRFIFQKYWLPVEIVSFLLFVALVGSLYLGRHAFAARRGGGK